MLNMILHHAQSGITGKVEAVSVMPDGKAIAYIRDKWFVADELGPAKSQRL